MPTCPVCGFENAYGALVCAQCYNLLTDVPVNSQESTLPGAKSPPQTDVLSNHRHVDLNSLGADTVAMYFDYVEEPLIVHVGQQAILGRRTSDPTMQPRIDLTPYGAFSKGISRVHAIIRRAETGLTIEDLASSNGTWVNGDRLQAYTRTPLKSGDHVLLGELSFEIHFR